MFLATVGGPDSAINIEDMRRAAYNRLPQVLFDMIDSGAGAEVTRSANELQYAGYAINPRQARPVQPAMDTDLFGDGLSMPPLLAPCGAARFIHPDGELALARAASAANIGYVVPHVAGHALESVRAAAPQAPAWYQLYKIGGPSVADAAIDRAAAAGFTTLVLTIDNDGEMRERDIRNGMQPLFSGNPL